MIGTIPIRIIGLFLLANGVALCQQRGVSSSNNLPDAPSVQASHQQESETSKGGSFHAQSAWEFLSAVYEERSSRRNSSDFFTKLLSPAPASRKLTYPASSANGLMARATEAASRTLMTHDSSGRTKLNTPYILAVLSTAVADSARRPYWDRPATTPLSNFGSTIGNDAGMNVLHEFGPGLQQLMKSHAPRFVSVLEDRISHR